MIVRCEGPAAHIPESSDDILPLRLERGPWLRKPPALVKEPPVGAKDNVIDFTAALKKSLEAKKGT